LYCTRTFNIIEEIEEIEAIEAIEPISAIGSIGSMRISLSYIFSLRRYSILREVQINARKDQG
jgi:hypothetical protein